MRPSLAWRIAACAVALVAACAQHAPPPSPTPTLPEAFTESGPWRESVSAETIARGDWWVLFSDPTLNGLEEHARAGSPRLRAAAARVEQARAIAGVVEAGRYPTLDVGFEASRYAVSGNRPDQPSKVPTNDAYVTNRFRVPLYAAYEVDLWGRLARQIEAADARAEASVSAYHTVLLTLQGDVAQTYFALWAAQHEQQLIERNLELRARALQVVQARKREGLASELDVARAQTDVALAQTELEVVARRRMELQHALAVLVGAWPEQFRVDLARSEPTAPNVPAGLPSELLERRPDITESKQQLIARHAEVGAAKVAFYPSLRLTGAFGVESAELADLLKGDSLIWLIGGQLNQALFDGGRRRAEVRRAQAAYTEALAQYQDRLLSALREVETGLAALRSIQEQSDAQARAVAAAQRAHRLAGARYKAGLAPLMDVLDAQRVSLSAERQQVQLRGQQLATSVALIKALGGGWEARAEGVSPDAQNRGTDSSYQPRPGG